MPCLRPDLLAIARGEQPADLVLRGAQIVNVYSGEIHPGDLAIADGRVVGLGRYDGREVVELPGGYLTPGLLDAHIHFESTLLGPAEFARLACVRGTTGAFIDPHEVANVLGADGVRWVFAAAAGLPVHLWVNVPSCVPASPLDDAGAVLDAEQIAELLADPQALGLAEMMNFPGAAGGWPDVLAKLAAAGGRPIDGHAPGLRGQALDAYLLAGPNSDHECTSTDEALDRLRRGCYVFLRQGSASHDLATLLPVLNAHNARRLCLCCDDLAAEELLTDGHIDRLVRQVVAAGVDPLTAVQMASLNTAERFGVDGEVGSLGAGRRADVVWVEDLADYRPRRVWQRGREVARDGACLVELPTVDDSLLRHTVRLAPRRADSFTARPRPGTVRVIGVEPGSLTAFARSAEAPLDAEGRLTADLDRDLLLCAVVERHRAEPKIGLGLVQGFGLRAGALATSVGHDSHHVTVVGTSRAALAGAVAAIEALGGGLVAIDNTGLRAALPLPLAGLWSDQDAASVAAGLREVRDAAAELGCALPDPFMTLGFLGLTVIPELRLTPSGLVDVLAFERCELALD